MSNVICGKCGAEASSKCPFCRTVFPKNQYEAILSYALHHKTDAKGKVTISYDYIPRDECKEAGVERALESLARVMKDMAEGASGLTFKGYACEHDWQFKPGCKSSIGCGH